MTSKHPQMLKSRLLIGPEPIGAAASEGGRRDA
jgi:hypothetical protein